MIVDSVRKVIARRSRSCAEEQIAFALKQAELGTSVLGLCRKMGICDVAFYNWRKKYGGLGPSELRRLKQLKDENGKLKRLVAGDAPGCCSQKKV